MKKIFSLALLIFSFTIFTGCSKRYYCEYCSAYGKRTRATQRSVSTFIVKDVGSHHKDDPHMYICDDCKEVRDEYIDSEWVKL